MSRCSYAREYTMYNYVVTVACIKITMFIRIVAVATIKLEGGFY